MSLVACKLCISPKHCQEVGGCHPIMGEVPSVAQLEATVKDKAYSLDEMLDARSDAIMSRAKERRLGVAVEKDPSGKNQHEAGAKLDAGKRRDGLVLLSFARALAAVSEVGTYGANKYTDNGWMSVPNGVNRYTDALLRHILSEASGELTDKDTGLLHAAHAAWNALARLDLMIRESEK